MNELNHGPGKGDKDRSPGWRTNYDDIHFPLSEGFARRGNRLVKAYGGKKAVFNHPADCACSHEGMDCGAEEGGYSCTLPYGHEGNRVACGKTEHRMSEWSPKQGNPRSAREIAESLAWSGTPCDCYAGCLTQMSTGHKITCPVHQKTIKLFCEENGDVRL